MKQLKFNINLVGTIRNILLISAFFSIALMSVQYLWYVYNYPIYILNSVVVVFAFVTSVCAILYSVLFVYKKKYYSKQILVKSMLLVMVIYVIFSLFYKYIPINDVFLITAKKNCSIYINLHENKNELIFNCLVYFGGWAFFSNIILWLQTILIIEIFEKIGLLNRSTK